ncbi:PTB domain-containing engulfment adapter protein 1 [Orchesella cincta]|uniref:PTB domain-containing engulfment adapter protein 1 n=1 Tax=Orchesella cincta TaxID=48709 RepID=A0A1D2MZV5_ORCCI|nr:PTB domain-containing engulfment adapter protein 1 [Orchesella cincta]
MMRNNGLLKWSLHKNKNGSNNGKNWIHPPDSLTNGHIAYLVKFLGVTEAEQPKGIDVVKDCIRKLKLDEEIRRAEGGKTPKAEVTISIDGVAVQEPKGKKVLHQFPLHQISYCADDKAEKKFFSFIAKDGEVHRCFVFSSEKLAEEITLTIGQAFDLAYRRFLESSGREMELKRELMVLQKRIAELENENSELRAKLGSSSCNSDGKSITSSTSSSQDNVAADMLICPPVPPRGPTNNVANDIFADFTKTANEIEKKAQESKHVEGILFENETDTKPRGAPDGIEAPPRISPPPKGKKTENLHVNGNGNTNGSSTDIFGSDPFFTSPDPFGMPNFSKSNGNVNGSVAANNTANNAFSNGFSTQMNGLSNPSPFANNTSALNGMNNSFNINDMNSGSVSSSSNNSPKNYSNLTGLFAGEGSAGNFTFQNNLNNAFNVKAQPQNIDNALQILDKKIEEMKLGFSRGIHNDDFPLESLDPLRQTS